MRKLWDRRWQVVSRTRIKFLLIDQNIDTVHKIDILKEGKLYRAVLPLGSVACLREGQPF